MKELNNEEKQKVLELYEDTFWTKKQEHYVGPAMERLKKIEDFFGTRDVINIIDCLNKIEEISEKYEERKQELVKQGDYSLDSGLGLKEVILHFQGKFLFHDFDDEDDLTKLKGNLRQLVALCDTTDLYELKNIYDDLKGE